MATKRITPSGTSEKADATKPRTPNAAFKGKQTPSAALAAVIGPEPVMRTEVSKKVWEYIKLNKLQDAAKRTMINADTNLMKVFGRAQVSMFEMTKLINQHLSTQRKPEQASSDTEQLVAVRSASQRSVYSFRVGESYTRNDVFRIIDIPEPKGGPWFTGYASHGADWFVFCGVGIGGRTGHDYENHFVGENLHWSAKGPSKIQHTSIQELLNPVGRVYLFYRENDRDPFTFAGLASQVESFDTTPVKVIWRFTQPDGGPLPSALAEEVDEAESATVFEGAKKSIQVNVYERDPNARRKCIEHWGTSCVVCSFNFAAEFGDLGAGFIHVHHLRPLGEIGEQYELDPIADMRPVCPNCHAMLHRERPAMSIAALQAKRQVG